MARRWNLGPYFAVAYVAWQFLLPYTASADDPDPGHFRMDPKKPPKSITVRVDPDPNGYTLHISGRMDGPGVGSPPAPSRDDLPRTEAPPPRSEPIVQQPAPAPAEPAGGPRPVVAAQPVVSQPRLPPPDPPTIRRQDPNGQQITMKPIMVTAWSPTGEPSREQLRNGPQLLGYYTYVDGRYQGITWQPTTPDPPAPAQPAQPLPADVRPAGGGALDPYSVAIDVLARIPLPDIKLRMNPTLGLVALPSWYWAEGYDGGVFGDTRTVAIPPAVGAEVPLELVPADDPRRRGTSFTVEVRVWGSRYEWSFGDGSGQTTRSLGKPYPAESDIRHTYQHSSLRYPAGFPVRMTAEFAAEFSVDGGAPQSLPSVRRTYESTFRVQEIQPVLLRAR